MFIRTTAAFSDLLTPLLPTGTTMHVGEAAGQLLIDTGQAELMPDAALIKTQMLDIWEVLPLEVRVVFRPLKTAVLDAINDNCFDEVALLIQGASVPPEYVGARTALLALLTTPVA